MTFDPGLATWNRDGRRLSDAELHRIALQQAREASERQAALTQMRALHALSAQGLANPKPMIQQAREIDIANSPLSNGPLTGSGQSDVSDMDPVRTSRVKFRGATKRRT